MSESEDPTLKRYEHTAERSADDRSHDLRSVEALLARLSPRDDRLDRERVAFLTGRASVAAGGADWRRHPVWPPAFAAMSALAATLLAILITRPTVTGDDVPMASAPNRFVAFPQAEMGPAQNGRASTLSARDARYGDIEALLAARTENREAWPEDIDRRPRPILTPAAWAEVSDDLQTFSPPARSSSLILFRGVNS